MNQLLKPLLRKFVIVFFNDILVYSDSWELYIGHLIEVFKLLHQHCLFVRETKCVFGLEELSYLGHIISPQGIKPDIDKIEAVIDDLVSNLSPLLQTIPGVIYIFSYWTGFLLDYILPRPYVMTRPTWVKSNPSRSY